MKNRRSDSELTVITRAKELSSYIFIITEKSPKKFRFTLVTRLQNYCLDIIEKLYMANSIILNKEIHQEDIRERKKNQQDAMTRLRLLGYMSMVARESGCILPEQYRNISEKIMETQKILYSWIESDKSRISQFSQCIKG